MENIELINFIDLNMTEKQMVLDWRNNKRTSKFMYEKKNISLENHLKYIESLKTDLTKIYFLVKQDNIGIGVIDFTNIDLENKFVEIGLYSNPEQFGFGNFLMNQILCFPYNILYLEVFENNFQDIDEY